MHLFKKLSPILGKERIGKLQAVYLAGDEEDKRNVERILNVIHANTFSGIHPPPFSKQGKYPLGMVISGDKQLYPFYLNEDDFFHVGVYGQTGRGKTNAMLHILSILDIPWLVFDWKRTGYRSLKALVFTVGRDIAPLHLNPLIPPPGVDKITWYKQFIQCISHAYFLGHGCEVILQDVIGKDTKTLIDILRRLQTYPAKWRKLQWLQSTERAIQALCYGGISNVLNVNTCQSIDYWLERNIVLELDALTESEAKFFVNILMSQIYLYRKEHQHSGLKHVTVIEEAHNVLKKEVESVEAKSVMDKIFREVREYGESIIIIDQMPSTILDSAFANTATQITFNLKHENDVRAAGSAMMLDVDEQKILGQLPVGTAIIKLQHRWHAPFMLQFPMVPKAGKATDDMLRERMAGYSGKSEVILPGIGEPKVIQVIPDIDKEWNKLLASIAKEPLLGIADRYKKTCLSGRAGNQAKRKMLDMGFIREIKIKTQKGRIKLLELTDKGQ